MMAFYDIIIYFYVIKDPATMEEEGLQAAPGDFCVLQDYNVQGKFILISVKIIVD